MTEPWGGDPTQPVGGMADRTRAMPPPPRQPGPGGYDDDRERRRRIWLLVALVVAAVIIVVLVVVLLTGGSSNSSVSITSFNVPSTVTCSGPTTIGVSWSTTNATEVVLSIDGPAPFKTYSGSSGADTVPFACNGASHTYTLTAKRAGGAQATQTQTVTQLAAPTTRPAPTTTPTTRPPPTTATTQPPPSTPTT